MDIMLDIETLGTDPGAPILQIGAKGFHRDRPSEDWLFEHFDIHIDLQSSMDLGLDGITADTLEFWFKQDSTLAYDVLFNSGRYHRETKTVEEALEDLTAWATHQAEDHGGTPLDQVTWWAKGPDFDMVLLEQAFRLTGLTVPWKYNMKRDLRTVQDITGCPDKDILFVNPIEHDAVADVEHQIAVLRHCLKVQEDEIDF